MPASTAASDDRPPATLTDWLRSRDDTQLATLLRRRPDLALPAPADLPALASRLSVRTSVQRALDGLDAFTLRVLEALALSAGSDGRSDRASALALLGPQDAGAFDGAVAELQDLALIWASGPALHLVTSVREALGPYPAGLGRPAAALQPAAAAALTDPQRVAELIADCDPDEREVLDRLAAGPPIGIVRDAVPPAGARRRRLRCDWSAAACWWPSTAHPRAAPRGGHRRAPRRRRAAGRLRRGRAPRRPGGGARAGRAGPRGRHGGAGDAAPGRGARRAVDRQPPAQLRAGGLGVRDLRRTARDLGVDEPATAVLVETAAAAGLLNATHEVEPVYLPTAEFDAWLARTPPERWTRLASRLAGDDPPAQPGQPARRARPGHQRARSGRRTRHRAGAARPGARAADFAAAGRCAARARGRAGRLTWQAPRRAGARVPLAEAVLAEADQLGLTVAAGLTGYTRTLLDGSRAVAEQVLGNALPDPVDHFLVQPDLTMVVPGPPTRELARQLGLVADLESTGGASVYRVTEASVRRALDAGRSSEALHAFLADHSRTPVPQALTYLVDDAARRHGSLRAGAASAYLRSDDEALLDRVVADRAVQALQLRRLARTVAISSAPVPQVLHVLRAAGYAPAAEAPDGEVIALDTERRRAPSRPPERPARLRSPVASDQQLAELVRNIRAGDALNTISTRVQPITAQVPGVTSAATMGVLREAIRNGQQVLLDCVEADGTAARHAIWPISMAGGMVRGHEPETGRLASFPLHRLTRVSVLDDEAETP